MPAYTRNTKEVYYLNSWMDRVSRSFAVVVSSLEDPLKQFMSAAYILCRVIDNIEDCKMPQSWKKQRFDEVSTMLKEPGLASEVLAVWEAETWIGLTLDEKQLMKTKDGLLLWRILAGFPEEVRQVIVNWARQMVEGMSSLQEDGHPPRFVTYDGIHLLRDVQDYNQYCWIVAGTVGHMATELVIQYYQLTDGAATILLQNSEACGRGLQKTNIIKDFQKDLGRGICYLPDEWLKDTGYMPLTLDGAPMKFKRKVLGNALTDLRDAKDYSLALPYEVTGYRMASLLCLLPALQTILFMARSQEQMFTGQHPSKISQATFAQCIQDARNFLKYNRGIEEYFGQVVNEVNLQLSVTKAMIAS